MTRVAVLFVDPRGVYPRLLKEPFPTFRCIGQCWDEQRDARTYAGPHPVVAHPPCARWSRLAESVYARTGKEEHRPGNDGGCFASALASVRTWGGVLEHPAQSKAWACHALREPRGEGWAEHEFPQGRRRGAPLRYWVCEVWQSAYGHLASKATWLLYVGERAPFELRWDRTPGTHAVAGDSRKRRAHPNPPPRLTGEQNLATPEAFALELIRLADRSRA